MPSVQREPTTEQRLRELEKRVRLLEAAASINTKEEDALIQVTKKGSDQVRVAVGKLSNGYYGLQVINSSGTVTYERSDGPAVGS